MEGNYGLCFGGQAVGKVQVKREGLYYRFLCRCRLSGEVVSRVVVQCGTERENLGVLTPDGEGFSLNTRIPVKRFSAGNPVFTVVPNRPDISGKFVPISPEEPFAYIQRLKESFLVIREGRPGILIEQTPGN